ncbi:hypothetical protein [Acuticoccus sp. I52.16.1]|uniref:hypothetical protein n=1 Tax=Acuticoccus sp. I52.16.1 TaxID=2928472 RepID=UPI001FCFFFA9|nr:hypothetical protein [Acuticoccus sp. I52.16.1]UOM36769.1 hypothetical protein MRB58_11540 [Acuticoccus sp. I52.16.1]
MRRLFGIVAVAIAVLFLAASLRDSWGMVSAMVGAGSFWAMATLAGLAYGANLLLLAAAFRSLLQDPRETGARPGLRAVAKVYARANVLKYVPGNIMHYVARQVLARDLGASQAAMAKTSFYEMGLLVLVAAALGSVVLVRSATALEAALSSIGQLVAGIAVVAVALVGALLLSQARHMRGLLPACGPGGIVFAILAYAVFFIATGLLLFVVILLGLPGEATSRPLQAIPAFTVAWLIGSVTPGASAGIGIREAVLSLLLAPMIGEDEALAAAFAMRIATTLGDLLFFLSTIMLGRFVGPPASSTMSS